MKLFKVIFRRETAAPLSAVVFASSVCMALVLARMVWTGHVRDYRFLAWNLFLAWLPLVFALLASDAHRRRPERNWTFRGLALAWLLFFPNAPYIFTDVIHLTATFRGRFWTDLVLILSCALTGLVLGFLSLFLMQGVVARSFGRAASWLFVAFVAALSGFGIYLGRFLRFNSWDVLLQPLALGRGVVRWAADPLANVHAYAFPVLFGTFLFIAYLMLYALTQLKHLEVLGKPADRPAGPDPCE